MSVTQAERALQFGLDGTSGASDVVVCTAHLTQEQYGNPVYLFLPSLAVGSTSNPALV
jgi:hypothetical protein